MEEQWIVDRAKLRELLAQNPDRPRKELAAITGRSLGWVKKWVRRLREADLHDERVLWGQSRARKTPHQVTFRKKLYTSLDKLQADLDEWLEQYNRERSHGGKYCEGRTPLQTFRETKHLAYQKMLEANFPYAEQVVDWGHSVQHLWAVADALYGEGQPAAARWVAQRKDELWTGDVERVIRALDALDLDCPSCPDGARQAPGYFRHNRKRMRYDHFRAQGYPIGSGTVESGAKNVVQRRLKRSGRGWQP